MILTPQKSNIFVGYDFHARTRECSTAKKSKILRIIMKNNYINLIPDGITFLRIIFTLIFLFLFLNDYLLLSIVIFAIAIFTDVLDGYLARKLDAKSSTGAYLDIFADFFLVLTAFIAFVYNGMYPYWVLILIILVFLQFLLTSKFKILVYDPVGKYYGSFLFGIILITLVAPVYIYQFLLLITVLFTIISLLSRYLFFIIKNRR